MSQIHLEHVIVEYQQRYLANILVEELGSARCVLNACNAAQGTVVMPRIAKASLDTFMTIQKDTEVQSVIQKYPKRSLPR